MNLQSRALADRGTARRRTGKSVTWTTKIYTFFYLLVMAALIFGIATYRIHLSRQISDLQRASHLATRECQNLDLDIQSLKLQRDELTSAAYVQGQIAAYNLQLRAPDPAQVRYVTVKYRHGKEHTTRAVAGRRFDGESRLSMVQP